MRCSDNVSSVRWNFCYSSTKHFVQNFELSQARERLVTLTATVAELEEDLGTARRDLIKSEELSSKHQRDLREVSRGLGLTLSFWVQAFGT